MLFRSRKKKKKRRGERERKKREGERFAPDPRRAVGHAQRRSRVRGRVRARVRANRVMWVTGSGFFGDREIGRISSELNN